MKHISDLKQITVIVVISLGRFVVVLKIWYFVFMSNSTHQMMIKSNELFFENVYQNITWMACSAASLLRYTYFSCVILSYILWALLNHITSYCCTNTLNASAHINTHTLTRSGWKVKRSLKFQNDTSTGVWMSECVQWVHAWNTSIDSF